MSTPLSQPEILQRSRRGHRGECPFCGREQALTFHHLIPKKLHRRPRFRKRYTREQLNRGIHICRQCHDGIHDRYDEMTLYKAFSDPVKLATDPELSRYFGWVARQKSR